MRSKERVLAAISLADVDRVPMDFNANAATLARLRHDLRVDTHADLLQALHVDIMDMRGVVDPVYCGPIPKTRELDGGVQENFWGWRTKVMATPTGPEEMFCDFVLGQAETVEQMQQHRWPQVDWFDFSDLKERLEPWRDWAVMASGASVWQHPTFLRSLDRLLMDMVLAPDMAEFLLDQFTDFYVKYFDAMFTAAPGQIDILRIADDLGMQDRLLISPDLFERFMAERLRRLVDMAHSHGVKVMFHSCGAIAELIPALMQVGVDILDPLQVTAQGMEPEQLKRQYGSELCFHGAIDTQYLLPQGSAHEVATVVHETIGVLGPTGFILSPSHCLQTDVPTENVLALYETGYRCGVASSGVAG